MKLKRPNFQRFKKYLADLPMVELAINWTKTHSLPGFFKVPIYDVVTFLTNETQRFDITTRANAIAFSFFLSLFPAILALFTLFPYFRNFFGPFIPEGTHFNQVLEEQILRIMPGNAGRRLSDFIIDIVDNPRIGLTSFGFLLALFFASNGMISMMKSFEKSYPSTFRRRSGLKKRLVAIEMTLVIGVMVIASVVLVILGNLIIGWLADHINADAFTTASLVLIRWVVIICLYYFGISYLYRLGASTYQKFNWFTPGASLATLLSLLSSLAFSFFVDNFGTYNKLYGSIGTIIVVMLWIQINSFLILVGYELNASIAVNRDLKMKMEGTDD